MREHLFSRLLVERRLIGDEELKRITAARDDVVRRGGRATVAQVLVVERRLSAADAGALAQEVEVRGRSCFKCRRAFLVAPGGPRTCPACGGPAELPPRSGVPAHVPAQAFPAGPPPNGYPAGPPPAFAPFPTSAPPPPAFEPEEFSPTGRFQAADFSPSGRFKASDFSPSSGKFQAGAAGLPQAVPTPTYPGQPASGKFTVPGYPPRAPDSSLANTGLANTGLANTGLANTNATTPGPPPSTDPGSRGDNSKVRNGSELKALGPYDLIQELGRGGMGVVYKARHRQKGNVVALKVLLSGEFASPKMLQRFQQEAKTASKLIHDNIVPLHDVGEVDGIHYFTMQFIEGDLFSELIKGRGLSARRGAEILRDVAYGAQHAHDNGIIHRDLKPANVIIEKESGTPFIMDFGLAKDLDGEHQLSKTGVAIGTPYYMPPEQAQGKHREIDARTDVYALGAILYEILAKKVPFNANTQNDLIRKIVEEEPVPPSKLRAGVPADLETIALKALRKPKDERYESAEEFAKDIERALAGKAIRAKRPPPWTPLVQWAKRRPGVAAGIAGGALLFIIGVSVIVSLRNAAERDRIAREEQAKKDKEEAEKKAKEQELERLKQEATTARTTARNERLATRMASSASAANASLRRAETELTKALSFDADKPDPLTLYERGLARRDLGHYGEALDDLARATQSAEVRARALVARGVLALRHGQDRDLARRDLERAADPSSRPSADEDAARGLARAYLKFLDGDARSAISDLRELALRGAGELAPDVDNAIAFLELSGIDTAPGAKIDQKAVTSAREAADRAVAGDRMRYHFLVDRAIARAVASDLPGSLADASVAREVIPDWEEASLAEAWAHARGRKPIEFSSAIEAARERARDRPRAREAIDDLESRLRPLANSPKTPLKKPGPQRQPGEGEAAGGEKKRILFDDIQMKFDFKAPESQQKWAAARERGGQSEGADALTALKEMEEVEQEPESSAEMPLFRGLLLAFRFQKLEAARDIAQKVVAKVPRSLLGQSFLGFTELRLKNYVPAEAALKRALEVDSKLRTAHLLLADVYGSSGRAVEQVKQLGTLHELLPGDPEAWRFMLDAATKASKPELAIAPAQRAAAQNPTLFGARIVHVIAFMRAKQWGQARDVAEKVEKDFPDNFHAKLELGRILRVTGNSKDAREKLEQALTLAPEELKPTIENELKQLP